MLTLQVSFSFWESEGQMRRIALWDTLLCAVCALVVYCISVLPATMYVIQTAEIVKCGSMSFMCLRFRQTACYSMKVNDLWQI